MVTPELKAMETSSSSTLVTWEQFAAENQFTFNIMSFQVPVYMFVSPSVFSKCVATITVPVYMYVLIMSLHLAITSFLTSYKAIQYIWLLVLIHKLATFVCIDYHIPWKKYSVKITWVAGYSSFTVHWVVSTMQRIHKHVTINHAPHRLSLQSREHLSVVAICFLIKPGGIVRGMVDMYGTR